LDRNGTSLSEVKRMNTEFNTYFLSALHDAKIADIRKKYPSRKGFSVRQHVEIEKGLKTDVLVKKKGAKTTFFEIVTLPVLPDKQDKIEKLRKIAKHNNYDFRLIAIAKPIEPSIEIEWLNEALLGYFVENQQDAIYSMAKNAVYKDLETDIQSLKIADENSSAYVNGSVSVNFNSGVHAEIGDEEMTSHHFPFQGKLLLNLQKRKIEEAEVIIDTLV
jgi:hypothetical protein